MGDYLESRTGRVPIARNRAVVKRLRRVFFQRFVISEGGAGICRGRWFGS